MDKISSIMLLYDGLAYVFHDNAELAAIGTHLLGRKCHPVARALAMCYAKDTDTESQLNLAFN